MLSATEVCLIQPPNIILANPTMYFPLSLLYLGASLEAHNISVLISDLRQEETLEIERIPKANIFGITATSGEIGMAVQIARLLKKRNPSCTTIIGGAHASLAPGDCINNFDTVVVGEGEKVLLDIVQNRLKGVFRPSRIKDLDSLPFPARHLADCFSTHLFPGEKYGEGPRATTIIWSRGCPFRCAYCANIYHSPVVYRSPENIAAEFEQVKDTYGVSAFRVEDDNLGVNMPWLRQVLEAIPRGTRLKGHMRVDLVSHDVAAQLRAAGFEEIGLGVEACDNRVLKLINKRITERDCYNAVKVLKHHGLRVRVYFMAGLPGETEETIQKNMEFMRRAQPTKYTLSVTQPYVGSKLAEEPEKFGARIINPNPSSYWNFAASSLELDTATNKEIMGRHDRFKRFLQSEEWK